MALMTEYNVHCRLCGVLKPSNTLLHLSWDKKSRDEVLQKLLRINACENDMFADDVLPKTVCYLCLNTLSNAFNFVDNIEKAQTVLNDLYFKLDRKEDKNHVIEDKHIKDSIHTQDINNADYVEELMKATDEPIIDNNNMDEVNAHDFNINTENTYQGDKHDTEMNAKATETKAFVNAVNIKDKERIINIQDPNFYLLLQPSVVYGYEVPRQEGTPPPVPFSCMDTNVNNIDNTEKGEITKDPINIEDIEYQGYPIGVVDHVLGRKDIDTIDIHTENTIVSETCKVDSIIKDGGDIIGNTNNGLKSDSVKIKKKIAIKKAKKIKQDTGKELKKKPKKNKRLPNVVALQTSNRVTWKDYEWKCAFCNGLFSNSDEMTSHLIKVHGWCNIYSCTDCKKKNYRLDKFVYHVKRHRHDLKYSCYKCNQQFASMMHCRTHTLDHSKAEFVCPGCSTIFNSANELNKHTLIYYKGVASYDWRSEPKSEFSCSKCSKTFNRKCDFVKHLARHQKKRTHICDKCGAGFLGQGPLNNHMANHSETRPFKCEVCGSCFKTPTQLRAHVMTHEDKALFICDYCNKGFNIKRKLVGHITRMHMEIMEQFSCEYCEKKFNDKRGLKRHLHLHTGDMPYSCEYCPKKFRDRGNYSKHLKRIHDKYLAKKTYTQKGTFPINPVTGEIIIPDLSLVEQWKDKILTKRVPKGPKKKLKQSNL